MGKLLTSLPTLVQSPFIIVTIGGVTFGSYTNEGNTLTGRVTYPNYMKSVSINKVNGTVNTYTLNFQYQVRFGEDPNLLDKIFSKASKDRRITFQYGDWNAPTYIYKEEQAIITNVTSTLDMNNSMISYTIQATSDAIGLTSNLYNFASRVAKPSDVIIGMLSNAKFGLKSIFSGMRKIAEVINKGLIASNDIPVKLIAMTNVTVLEYLNYLVDSMKSSDSPNDAIIQNSKYYLTIHDDLKDYVGGTYFKVTEVNKNTKTIKSTDTYEIDVNFPTDNFVTQFSLTNDQSWAILYEYTDAVKQESYSYKINDEGQLETIYAPSIVKSDLNQEISPSKSSWWTKMTQFPIEATLTLKGLTRPSMLMTYVKVNVLFTGGIKHISSGTYIITKQIDEIDSSGYRTTLTLLRVAGDS